MQDARCKMPCRTHLDFGSKTQDATETLYFHYIIESSFSRVHRRKPYNMELVEIRKFQVGGFYIIADVGI